MTKEQLIEDLNALLTVMSPGGSLYSEERSYNENYMINYISSLIKPDPVEEFKQRLIKNIRGSIGNNADYSVQMQSVIDYIEAFK